MDWTRCNGGVLTCSSQDLEEEGGVRKPDFSNLENNYLVCHQPQEPTKALFSEREEKTNHIGGTNLQICRGERLRLPVNSIET